jgi:hypothetical protein
VNVFLLNRAAEPVLRRPLFQRPWMNHLAWGAQWTVGIYVIVSALSMSATLHHNMKSLALTNPLYGIWKVDEFTADGQVRPPLLTDDLRWQRMIFTSQDALTIQEMNGLMSRYVLAIDTQNSTLSFKNIKSTNTSSPWWSEWGGGIFHPNSPARSDGYTELSYSRPQPDAVILQGMMKGHHLRMTLKKEERRFVLNTHGFHWINDEYDFYNEYVDQINEAQ